MSVNKKGYTVNGLHGERVFRNAPLHHADTQLENHVLTLENAFEQQDFVTVAQLLDERILATFYGLHPDRLQTILEQLIAQDADVNGTARGMLLMFPERQISDQEILKASMQGANNEVISLLRTLASTVDMRLRGVAHRSSTQLRHLDDAGHLAGVQFGATSGWDLMIPVQSGITAMLAGDFARALGYFTQAQLHPLIPSLSFLTRDAYAKSALLHATFGDEREAYLALDRAAKIPRTISWAEYLIDSTVSLTEAMLFAHGVEDSVMRIDEIPMHLIGELWPFYVIALERVYERADRRRELVERLNLLEQAPLPRFEGESIAGSVFPVTRASISLRQGDIEIARQLLDEADPDYVGTQVTLMYTELAVGRVQQSMRIAATIESASAYRSMRRINLWRICGLASAYVRLEKPEPAREAFISMLQLPGGLRPDDIQYLSTAVVEYAQQHIEAWPTFEITRPSLVDIGGSESTGLTSREFEVVRMLAENITQREIASRLFISVNTLKTHLKAIYKKLNVTSREAAVLRAKNDGWL